ncbi:hypothetical protein KIL84_015342 [Mauremys mutica]|uniref:Uncharacterized protein n=1 Tax=Mauremys mutica TaxID=74926 RepID=A0A9D4ARX7_9SAUR|nr:hypothetical protein KIL84_015342 [Mauremys mutica]
MGRGVSQPGEASHQNGCVCKEGWRLCGSPLLQAPAPAPRTLSPGASCQAALHLPCLLPPAAPAAHPAKGLLQLRTFQPRSSLGPRHGAALAPGRVCLVP